MKVSEQWTIWEWVADYQEVMQERYEYTKNHQWESWQSFYLSIGHVSLKDKRHSIFYIQITTSKCENIQLSYPNQRSKKEDKKEATHIPWDLYWLNSQEWNSVTSLALVNYGINWEGYTYIGPLYNFFSLVFKTIPFKQIKHSQCEQYVKGLKEILIQAGNLNAMFWLCYDSHNFAYIFLLLLYIISSIITLPQRKLRYISNYQQIYTRWLSQCVQLL